MAAAPQLAGGRVVVVVVVVVVVSLWHMTPRRRKLFYLVVVRLDAMRGEALTYFGFAVLNAKVFSKSKF